MAAILTLGIPHPTGYPTYTLLGRLFQLVPLSTPVFRAALESLVPAGLAAGLLTGWMCFILGSQAPGHLGSALVAGTSFGFAPLIFSQAVNVDVHGLQALIIVLALWWITLSLSDERGKHARWLFGLSIVLGLGFGNHVTLILLAPAVVMALAYQAYRSRNWKLVLTQVSLILAGSLVYLYLPIRAHAYPALNWGNPQTWPGFLWEVTGNPYRGLLFSTKGTELLDRIRSVANLLLHQFGALGLAAGAIGSIQYSFRIKWLRWVLVWTFFVYLAFAIGYHTEDSIGYLIATVMVFAVWIGLAVPSLLNIRWRQISVGLLLVVILMISIWISVPGVRNRLDPRPLDQPARYAEQFLKDAPLDAIVYTTTDQDSFPLWYYHFGLHERPDLRIIVLPLTQFVWYQQTLVHTYPEMTYPAVYSSDQPNTDWGKEIARLNASHPVCNTSLSGESDTGVEYQCRNP